MVSLRLTEIAQSIQERRRARHYENRHRAPSVGDEPCNRINESDHLIQLKRFEICFVTNHVYFPVCKRIMLVFCFVTDHVQFSVCKQRMLLQAFRFFCGLKISS